MYPTFRGYPFVALVTAPKIVVLVHHHFFDEMRVDVLVRAIFQSWPLLVFILFSACLAGLIMWILDRKKNREEFPKKFLAGTWEGKDIFRLIWVMIFLDPFGGHNIFRLI